MQRIRVTKEFSFEMAHALSNYDGHCRHVHGHSYKLFVTVIGVPISDVNHPKLGMVIDFGELKKIVNSEIIERYDHALVLAENDKTKAIYEMLESNFGKVKLVDYQPTCENMISRFATAISTKLPSNVELHSLKLHETATSYAQWFAEDNVLEIKK
ncbi:MAG: 6-carboxytetrahydropterin synthase [Rikenellaceae bacterium]